MEKNRRDVEEKSEQLKTVSNLAALISGFAVVAMVEFQFQSVPEDAPEQNNYLVGNGQRVAQGYIRTTDESDAGSAGIFSGRTNPAGGRVRAGYDGDVRPDDELDGALLAHAGRHPQVWQKLCVGAGTRPLLTP
eukprot:4881188-Pyramimonas_sp.AAC.1